MVLLVISFIAGVLTIAAPCILPMLPIVVGGAVKEGKYDLKKSILIIGSLGVSVILFTLVLKASTVLIEIPQSFWSYISGGLIALLGLITLFPGIWSRLKINNKISQKSNQVIAKGYQKKSFKGDVLTGVALGPVFTTCSPTYFVVLATVLPESPVVGFIYLMSFVVGLMLALFLVSVIGQKFVQKVGVLSNSGGWFKKLLATIFIIIGILIMFGYDKKIEAYLIQTVGWGSTNFEQNLLDKYFN